jgi:hypothetical protein
MASFSFQIEVDGVLLTMDESTGILFFNREDGSRQKVFKVVDDIPYVFDKLVKQWAPIPGVFIVKD